MTCIHLLAVYPGAVPGSKKAHIGKRTPTEFWTDTLRRTGYGITPETLNHQSLTGLKHQDMSYKSTSHFLRQVAGTEKMSKTLPSDGSGESVGFDNPDFWLNGSQVLNTWVSCECKSTATPTTFQVNLLLVDLHTNHRRSTMMRFLH